VIEDAGTEKGLLSYRQSLQRIDLDGPLNAVSYKNRRGSGEVRFTSISILDTNNSERYIFDMQDSIRFKFSCKVLRDINDLYIYIGLRSWLFKEIVTSAKLVLSEARVRAGTEISMLIEFPDIYIRPGEYPLYFWLGDSSPASQTYECFDIVDDMTLPLVIRAGNNSQSIDIDPSAQSGYFSLPSRLLSIKMLKQNAQ
jgi:hypothetical protein